YMRPHDGSAIEPLNLRGGFVRLGRPGKLLNIDADREFPRDDRPPKGFNPPAIIDFSVSVARYKAAEVLSVVRCLKADDVELKKSLDEPVVGRNGFEQLGRRERNVKKKANPLPGTKRA